MLIRFIDQARFWLYIVRPQSAMNLVKQLEHVIGLTERPAPYTEIKGCLIGIREEAEGQAAATAHQLKLNKEHAKEVASLKATIAKLKKRQVQSVAALRARIAKQQSIIDSLRAPDQPRFSGWPPHRGEGS